ncbi:MAG TPA: hypothetical protein VF590_01175 [Isosphaeraceae bacterium]
MPDERLAKELRPKPTDVAIADLDAASRDRLADAKVLAAAGRPASAIAAGLYALEIRLKVLVCKRLDLPALRTAFQIHDLEGLLVLSGLERRIEDPSVSHVKVNWDAILTLAASLNELRYSPAGSPRLPIGARRPRDAVTFLAWLEDPQDGALSWISSQP